MEEKKKRGRKPKVVDVNQVEKEIIVEYKEKKENTKNHLMKKLDFTIIEGLIILLIFVTVFCGIGFLFGGLSDEQRQLEDGELDKFIEYYNEIKNNYYGEVTQEELLDAAISGMFSVLDEYSGFLEEETNSFDVTLTGTYMGLGIEIYNDAETKAIIISEVFNDTPASDVGLKPGDEIITFNNENVSLIDTGILVDKISAAENINLTVIRDGVELTFELQKRQIVLQSVSYEMLEDQVGYVKIDLFALNTPAQVKNALLDLESQGMNKLVIDVRNNTGGYLTTALEIGSLFLDSSHIVYQTDDGENNETVYSIGDETKQYPIVILQNGASASASELLTVALKENLDAYIIGTTSYGKGTVQTVSEINGQEYKFTTKKWLSPEGNWINEVGIAPDLEIILDENYYLNPSLQTDNVLNGALNYLKAN